MPPKDFKQRPARRPATRASAGPSRWSVFAAGVCVGAIASAAVFLYEPVAPERPSAPAPAPAGEASSTRFEFYTVLPEKEIAIPPPTLDAAPESAPDAPRGDGATGAAERYLLQVGSFKNLEDADRLKARLAFLGLEARIQTVSIDGAETWHRVRIGPYDGRAALGAARARLAENDLDAMVLKLR